LGAARGGSAVEAGVAVWEREEREVAHRDREREEKGILSLLKL
jgi:hypothetical protein